MNYLFFDVETTGLNCDNHSIVQLAAVPVIDGIEQEPFSEYCQPHRYDNIEQGAVNTHGITVARMHTFQAQQAMIDKLIAYAQQFNTKFVLAGYNVAFDKRFLSATFARFKKNHEFFKLFTLHVHDVLPKAKKVDKKALGLENHKLGTLAKAFNIEIQAHDALSDIRATIAVDHALSVLLGENTEQFKPIVVDEVVPDDLIEPAQLHVHSQYNMRDAIPSPEEWAIWCRDNKVPAFSVVDQGSAVSLYHAIHSKIKEVTAIPGLGLNVKLQDGSDSYFTLNAWAISNTGYFNLMSLASDGFKTAVEEDKVAVPIVTINQIIKNREGLRFGLSDINGYVGQAVSQGNEQMADERFEYLLSVFGHNYLYVELNPVDILYAYDKGIGFQRIHNNAMATDGNLQSALNRKLWELAQKHNCRCIPVSGAGFIDPADKILQDCICKNSYSDGRHFHESYHVRKSKDLYMGLKAHLGVTFTLDIYKQCVAHTLEIAEDAKAIDIKLDFHLPHINIPDHIQAQSDDYDTQTYLYLLDRIKAHGRWNNSPEYKERFVKEMDVIKNNSAMNFIPYFLVYDDLGEFARNAGFMQNIARGSAGGSLVSYYLKVIHVDPIAKKLPFERFLSHARIKAGSWPDIDMDIAKDARPYVMKYLQEKYSAGFAQIATFSTMKTKNAINDAMNALYGRNRNDPELTEVCKTIPDSPQGVAERDFLYGYTDQEGEYHSGQLDTNETLRNFFAAYSDIESIVTRLIGIVRGWSRHASAFVISTVDLAKERAPTMLMYDKGTNSNVLVTQYDAKMVEGSGLVKADILGLKTLSVVTECLNKIKGQIDYLKEDKGVAMIYRLPEDVGVYTDFYHRKTDSSFQFGSYVIKECLQDYCPTNRESISALTAIKRPGIMDVDMEGMSADKYYTKVKNGEKEPQYIHPDLEPILRETNGIMVYQESVMQTLVEICGYSWEETDQIRSAIAKKKHKVIAATFDRIRDATAQRGWTKEQSDALCHTIQAFSNYSFNKSHAFAYSELGYITMYLKNHHPLEWWSSVLNNEDEEDKMRFYVSLLGDVIKPPRLSNPSSVFIIENGHIIAPVSVIKGLGPKAVDEISAKGPFRDLKDFCDRIEHRKVDIGGISQLIRARAADCFMDPSLEYPAARIDFMEKYKKFRKCSSKFKDDLLLSDPLSIFLMERDANKTFNKSLLSDVAVRQVITSKWQGLLPTGKKGIPFLLGQTPVLNGIKVAQGLLEQERNQDEVAFIALFNESNVISGISKRTGRPYEFVSVMLSDGFMDFEGVDFDRKKPLRFPQNSLVYIRGTIEKGWKTTVRIKIKEIEKIEQ